MIDLTDVNTLLEIGASVVIIGGAGYGSYHWFKSRQRQIVCEYCKVVFTPKYFKSKKIRKGMHLEFAVCPECGEKNEFEVDDE